MLTANSTDSRIIVYHRVINIMETFSCLVNHETMTGRPKTS